MWAQGIHYTCTRQRIEYIVSAVWYEYVRLNFLMEQKLTGNNIVRK